MYCQNCGSEVESSAQYCTKCGAPQHMISGAGGVMAAAPAYIPATGGQAKTMHWIGQGWEMVNNNFGTFLLLTLIMLAVNSGLPLLIQGATTAGFQFACMKKLRGQKAELTDLFQGFQFFGSTLAAHIVISILVFIGLLLLIIPGLVAAAMYNFTFLFIVDKRMGYRAAMRASHAIVKQDYFGYTMFMIALALLNLAGVVCFVVGLLVTIPVSMAAVAVAYRDAVGLESPSAPV
jgi:uncharacterized membrane protein